MNLTISPITNIRNVQNKNFINSIHLEKPETKNTKELSSFHYNDLTFKTKGRVPYSYIKPTFESPRLQVLRDKIAFYLTKFPEGARMPKPVLLKTDAGNFAIKVDKTLKNKTTKIYIKDLKKEDNLENWNALEKTCEGLEMFVDHKGQMVSASSYMPGSLNILFERTKNARKIQYGNYFYLPIANEEYLWKRLKEVPGMKPYYSAAEKMEFQKTDLQEFFSEMARRKTSFLEY